MNHQRLLRNDALADPRFWAMHYYMLIGTEEVDTGEFIEPFFGVSNEEVNKYFLREFNPRNLGEPWSYVEVTVSNGFAVRVEYTAENCETRFLINHPDWQEAVCLGHESGHFALPAFRWSEVAAIGRAATGVDAARAMLLMFPAVWLRKEDGIEEVRATLVEAWSQLGVAMPNRLREMVEQTTGDANVGIRWWNDPQLGWINDGRYSFRNPETRMCRFDEDRFAKVAGFFAGIRHDP